MARLTPYYDRVAAKTTLNTAIALTLMTEVFFILGVFELLRYFHDHETLCLINGPIFMLLGAIGILHGSQVIHAVARRIASQSGKPPKL